MKSCQTNEPSWMKGETSVPYFCACRIDQFGRRGAFDMAVQFRFQKHSTIPVTSSKSQSPSRSAAEHRALDNSARSFRSAMVPPELRQITIMSVQRTTAAGGMETSFGFRQVGEGDKQPLVNDVFHRVANRYDLMNDLMSAGLHRLWKDGAGLLAQPAEARPAGRCSTWPAAPATSLSASSRRRDRNAHATVLDINGSMLAVGRDRAEKMGLADNTDFVEANAEELPFADDAFDAYTIAFGIRNVPRIETALAEAFRVLKPGGRFLCLEFSEVDMPLLDHVYEAWSFNAIPRIGQVGDRRRRALFLSGRIDPQVSATSRISPR